MSITLICRIEADKTYVQLDDMFSNNSLMILWGSIMYCHRVAYFNRYFNIAPTLLISRIFLWWASVPIIAPVSHLLTIVESLRAPHYPSHTCWIGYVGTRLGRAVCYVVSCVKRIHTEYVQYPNVGRFLSYFL